MSTHVDNGASMNTPGSCLGQIVFENGNAGHTIHMATGPYVGGAYRLVMEVRRGWFNRSRGSDLVMDRMEVLHRAMQTITKNSGVAIVEYSRQDGEVVWPRLWTPKQGIVTKPNRPDIERVLFGGDMA